LLLAKANNKQKTSNLFVAGAKLVFRNTRKSIFDVLTATRPGDLVAARAKSW
jgi:hypothetical protein